MSFFRPHKTKPRQFNYIPRHYDPVKEEREQRRRELHGTSSEDDMEEYVPGKYIRTQREARDAARENESNSSSTKIRNMAIMAVMLGIFTLVIVPRFVKFFEMAREEQEANKAAEEAAMEAEKEAQEWAQKRLVIVENVDDIEEIDDKQQFMQLRDEMEAWQHQSGNITFDEEQERDLNFEIFNIISERMNSDDSEAINAAYQEAIKNPEQWLKDNALK